MLLNQTHHVLLLEDEWQNRYWSEWFHHGSCDFSYHVETFTQWSANMQLSCIPEIPQALRYRLLSQWAVSEIQNILFCFISLQPPLWNSEVQGCCFWDVCVCESVAHEVPSLTPAAPCFSYPRPPSLQSRRQNSLSGKHSHLFSKSGKTETTLNCCLSKRPWNVVSGEETIHPDDL